MIPAAYALGGVPFGVLVGKWRGVDVRTIGSGNIGATNVGRALGRRFFFIVLALDALKGALPAGVASALVHWSTEASDRTPLLYALWLGSAVAAMLGHIFSPFLGFKGGKGVATGLGLALGIFPYMTLPACAALAVFVIVYRATRYVSAGSVVAAAVLPIAYVVIALWLGWEPLARQWPMLLMTSVVAALVIIRHRTNIARLWSGTEMKSA